MAGLGQKTYREWLTNVRKDAREMGEYSMEVFYNQSALDEHYEQFIADLQASLEENDNLNTHMWIDRAELEIERIKSILIAKFHIPPDGEEDPEDGEPVFGATDEGHVLGFPIFTDAMKAQAAAEGWQLRSNLSLTLYDLEEWLKGIPAAAVKAIMLVYGKDGLVVGYRVWVGDTT